MEYVLMFVFVLLGAAFRYLSKPSLFLFDMITSVPFSYYDLIAYEASRRLRR